MKFSGYLLLIMFIALNISCFDGSDTFGKVKAVSGDASVYSQKSKHWNPITKSQTIKYGDTIESTSDPLEIVFRNNSKLTLEPNSKIVVFDSSDNKNDYIFPVVYSGGILSEIKHKKENDFCYIVYTPVAYVQTTGGYFYVSHSPSSSISSIHAYDGNAVVYNTSDFADPITLEPGFTTTISYSNTPTQPKKLRYNQFRRVGYMFEPEVCKHFEVTFGFPVIPIPIPMQVIVSVPEQAEEPEVVEEHYRERTHYRNDHPKHNSNVSVHVNVNGGMPFFPVPVPLPGAPVPVPHRRVAPMPIMPPPVVAPLPVPVPGPSPFPGRTRQSDNNRNSVAHNAPVPHPPVPAPIPGPFPNPFKH